MIKYIQKLMDKLKSSEKGQGMVEYALIIAFVAAIAIFALNGGLKDAVTSALTQAADEVKAATSQATSMNGSGGNTGGGTNP